MAASVVVESGMKRRDFLGAAGAGLFVFFGVDLAEARELIVETPELVHAEA